MNDGQNAEVFFREFVIAFGFLNGIWVAVGINPEAEIFNAFKAIIEIINPESGFSILFTILPLIIMFGTLFLIYALGGWIGIGAVVSGFVGGLLVLASPTISIIFLLVGGGARRHCN